MEVVGQLVVMVGLQMVVLVVSVIVVQVLAAAVVQVKVLVEVLDLQSAKLDLQEH